MPTVKVSELNELLNADIETTDLFLMSRTNDESFKATVEEIDKRYVSTQYTGYSSLANAGVVGTDELLVKTASGLAKFAFSELDTRYAIPEIDSFPVVTSAGLNSTDVFPVKQASGQKKITVAEMDSRYLGAIPNISNNVNGNLVATNEDGSFLIRRSFKYPYIEDFMDVAPTDYFTASANAVVTNDIADPISGFRSCDIEFSGTSQESITSEAIALDDISIRNKTVTLNMDLFSNDLAGKASSFALEVSTDGVAWSTKSVLNDANDITESGTIKIQFAPDYTTDLYVRFIIYFNHASASGSSIVKLDNIALDIYPSMNEGGASGGSASTGRKAGGIISKVDDDHFAITDGFGVHYDYFTDPYNPVITEVTWSGITNALDTNLTAPVNWIGIDKTGMIVQSPTEFTRSERRDVIQIGSLYHINDVIVVASQNSPIVQSPMNQLLDLLRMVGTITDGNHFTFSGANLNIKKTYGDSLVFGGNDDLKDPNVISRVEQDAPEFIHFLPLGGGAFTRTEGVSTINPNIYGNNLTVPNNNFQNIRIYYSATANAIGVLQGSTVYPTLADAQAGILGESFDVPTELQTVPLRTILIVKKNTVALNNTANARFIKLGKFGQGIVGGSSSSTTTMQGSYNNSFGQPKIRLTSGIGKISFQDAITPLGANVALFDFLSSDGLETFFRITNQRVYVNQLAFAKDDLLLISPTTNNNLQVSDIGGSFLLRDNFRFPYIQDFKETLPQNYFTASDPSGDVVSATGASAIGGTRSASLEVFDGTSVFHSSSFDISKLSLNNKIVDFGLDYGVLSGSIDSFSFDVEYSTDNISWNTLDTTDVLIGEQALIQTTVNKASYQYLRFAITFTSAGLTELAVDNIRLDLYPAIIKDKIVELTTDGLAKVGQTVICKPASDGAMLITLPSVVQKGDFVIVKNMSENYTTRPVFVTKSGGVTIDDDTANLEIGSNDGAVKLVYSGLNNWYVI